MLNHLLTQLMRSLGVFFRTFRAFFQRQIVGVWSRIRRLTNFSRHATQVATESLNAAVTVAQKPTRREDYVETKRLFISKALIVKIVILLISIGLIGYFVVWPFVLSHFLTARFHVEDSRVPDWTGRVIVYSDKKKTVPLYAGRLEKGVLEGDGKQYDDSGVITYEGAFVGGLRTGRGKEYRDGVLHYEGQFSSGTYEGTGTLYDADGTPLYQGQFSDGKYNGRGRGYEAGVLRYEGAYEDGVEEGTGVSYYPTGEMYYKGSFSAGKPDGTGTAYTRTGRTLYSGGFAAGAYSGDGILYPEEGQEISGTFENNEPVGVVRWKRDGYLYYQGAWASGGPSGFGQIYNKANKVIYAGQFDSGTIDGNWLLTLGTDELREALGDGRTATADNAVGGFLLTARELGLTALCSYQSADSASSVHVIYLTPTAGDAWVRLMPGMDRVSFGGKLRQFWTLSVPENYAPPAGVTLPTGSYRAASAEIDGGNLNLLYPEEEKVAALVVWHSGQESLAGLKDVTESDPAADNAANEKMDALLDSLGMVEGDETGAVTADGDEEQNPYYGTEEPGGALSNCEDAGKAAELVDAMVAGWQFAEQQTALEENMARLELLLADAKGDVVRGTGSEETVSALEEQKTAMEGEIKRCAAERAKAQLRAQGAGDADLSEIDVSKVAMQFDPSDLKVNDLTLVAAAYDQAAGKDTEGKDYATEVREILLDLTEAYGQMQTALGYYEASAERVQSAASAYATGNGSKADWYNALSVQADRRAALVAQLSEFTRAANKLNTMTGGWVSRSYGWFSDEFGKFYDDEMAAAAASKEDAEKPEGAEEDTEKPEGTGAEEDAEKPEGSGSEEDAEKPEGAASERDAEKPEETAVPQSTEEPEQTAAPQSTEKPEETAATQGTEKPAETSSAENAEDVQRETENTQKTADDREEGANG